MASLPWRWHHPGSSSGPTHMSCQERTCKTYEMQGDAANVHREPESIWGERTPYGKPLRWRAPKVDACPRGPELDDVVQTAGHPILWHPPHPAWPSQLFSQSGHAGTHARGSDGLWQPV
eukprot:1568903-Amphidinium_carterae.2